MKIIGFIISGIWCVFTSLISPVWLTLAFLYLTGAVYRYDFSMEEGMAGILGAALLLIWLLTVLLPVFFFVRKVWRFGRKHLPGVLALLLICVLAGNAVCGWDPVAFLTTPGGMRH